RRLGRRRLRAHRDDSHYGSDARPSARLRELPRPRRAVRAGESSAPETRLGAMNGQPDSLLGFITGPSVSFWFMHSVLNLFKNDVENRFNSDWLLGFGP